MKRCTKIIPSLKLILISVVLFSCQTEEKAERKSAEKKKEAEEIPEVEMITTKMGIMTYRGYEDPFYEDTLRIEPPVTKVKIPERDSLFTIDYLFSASYPQSKLKEHEKFNKLVKEKVESYFKDHTVDGEGVSCCGFYVDAQFDATDFEMNDNYAGILFTEQDYFAGSAHYNHGYHSFHFDFKRNKEIKLTDIVLFKEGEAQKFSDAVNPDPSTSSDFLVLSGEDFTSDRPFMINYHELYLYYSDYEKGPSMTYIMIPLSKIKGYVNPRYKYLFED